MKVLTPTGEVGPEAAARRSTELGLVVLAVIATPRYVRMLKMVLASLVS